MTEVQFTPSEALRPYVNSIMVMANDDSKAHTNVPLYADGYPGIMFQQSNNGFYLLPKKKKLSRLFLYGQTLQPVSLDVHGAFDFIVFQLYPFAPKYLLDVNPRELNDDCFDLLRLKHMDMSTFAQKLSTTKVFEERVTIFSELLSKLITFNQIPPDDRIQQAISLILEFRGQTTVKEVRDQLFISERTFERQFIAQTGLTPKQFAKIIQFKSSLQRLSEENYNQLLDIGLDSGFADQSHFIRTFKKYTGATPTEFLRLNNP